MKNLRLGFSLYGVIIAVLQMIPNIIWALFPPSKNRLEGNVSSNMIIEYGEHILGVSIIILLIFLVVKGQEFKLPKNKWAHFSYIGIAIYWLCWVLYFMHIQYLPIIYLMVIIPPIAFFFAGMAEKVYPISILSLIFLFFHLSVALENFPIR